MSSSQVLFILTAAVILVSAFMVVSSRRIMHAAFWLIISLLGVAVIFILLGSGFFAVVQVLVYIGAIAILIIFGIMLTRYMMYTYSSQLNRNWLLVALVCLALFAGLVLVLSTWNGFYTLTKALPQDGENITALGLALTDPQGFAIAFELSSVLLVAAMIGAIYAALERKGGKE